MQRYKIFVPTVPENLVIGELKNILLEGINANTNAELTSNESDADLIILDFRHLTEELYEINRPEKTVILDYRDQSQSVFSHSSLLYFKRSIVNQQTHKIVSLNQEYQPIAYCLRQEYLNMAESSDVERDIDIAVLFDPKQDTQSKGNKYRTNVARYVKRHFKHRNIFVGIAGKAGEPGRSAYQTDYVRILQRAKIVVTCNPDSWEGDSRLFEALASGAAVLSDKMLTPVLNPFVNGEHLLYYDRDNLQTVGTTLAKLLYNEAQRQKIAKQGYEFVHQHHKPADRIQQVLDAVNALIKID